MVALPYFDFTDGETDAQRGADTCSRSHSKEQTGRAGIPAQAWCSRPDTVVFPPKSLFSSLELNISGGAIGGC